MRAPTLSGTEWRLALLLLAVAAAQAWLVRDLKFLASGLFGGDHAYQLGCIRAIAASLNPMTSCNVAGALPGYFPLYGTLVAYFARVTSMDALQAMFVTAVAFRVLSAFVVYRVFARLHGRSTGLVAACLWTALHPELIFKYTEFTIAIVVPLYYLALHRYVDRPDAGRAAWLGGAIAVLGYSHSVAFIGGVVIAGVAIVVATLVRGGAANLGARVGTAARHLPIFVGFGLLTLGYWWRPIFVHRGRTSLHYSEWTGIDLSAAGLRVDWALRTLADEFSFVTPPRAALTLLVLAGVAGLALSRQRARFGATALLAGVTFLWLFHYFATVPLLHVNFIPLYVQWMLWGFARVMLAAIPVALLFASAPGKRNAAVLEFAALALALVAVFTQSRTIHADPAMVTARAEHDPAITALRRWTAATLAPGAVALTTNELSFAWGAMTGRKTVVTRRGQNDAFIDMDVRNLDAARMLYGRDDTLRTRLLAQYGVQYVFWASNWFASEYQVRAPGDTVGFDPFMWFRDDARDAEAERAGLEIHHAHTWVDPALRGPDYPRFDLSIVTHRNYGAGSPWREDLGRRLEVAWAYPDSLRPRVVVLRVRGAD